MLGGAWKKMQLELIEMLNIATNSMNFLAVQKKMEVTTVEYTFSFVLSWILFWIRRFNLLKSFIGVYSVWLSHLSQSFEAEVAVVTEFICRAQCFTDNIWYWSWQFFFPIMVGTGLLFLYVDTQPKFLSNVVKIVICCVSFQFFLQATHWLLESGCWKQQITCSTSYMTFNLWLVI